MASETLCLQQGTAQAIQFMFSVRRNTEAASFAAVTSASMADVSQRVSAVLRKSSREALPIHPLCHLPRPILRNIRSHLTLPDIMALARTSVGLYNVVIDSPELWTAVETVSREAAVIHPSDLQAYVEYSVPEPLRVSLLSTGDMFYSQAPILARAIPRVATLHIDCCDLMSSSTGARSLFDSNAWSERLDVFTEPAPLLASLQLRYLVGHTIDLCYPAVDAVTIDYSLFGGVAPSLRRCRLASIQLPPIALCGAFSDVTNFSYCTSGRVSPALIALIFQAMPRIEALELEGFIVTSERYDGDSEAQQHAAAPATLRVLMCSFMLIHLDPLSRMLSFDQLQELCLSSQSAISMFADLADLYPATSGIQLGIKYPGGQFGTLGDSTPPVIFTVDEDVQLSDSVGAFTSITWLAIHEHFLNNDLIGPPPELPCLSRLCVRLASFSEYIDRYSEWAEAEEESSGFLIGDQEQPPWVLPSLREVRLSGPTEENFNRSATRASRSHPISVTMDDIARWIRYGLVFGESVDAKLDTVVLSRVWVADYDFCAGWNALTEKTASIQFEDESDPWYSLTSAMIYHTRSASLFSP